ncbi:GNAT family N-acetyltransferase [Saccharopolyspora spinosa]|uniref:Acetyltransferase (GNAT) family protein n=1 Tax=Saccharopolyspora spinosa TaxID=60894 RepID=A0A2N3XYS9_SACSN|nr:GNAT family N-acetyltransferase [Saccharopolyspora spinosa]PKW15802.1 acetyltransferase (GNAT) family protein [Saccharopolyspora spinosa]
MRPATSLDAKITQIYVSSWNEGFAGFFPSREVSNGLEARWAEALTAAPPSRWWVATRAEKVVGFAGTGTSRDPVDPNLGELDTIAVDPPCWRTGRGRLLMDSAVDHLCRDGFEEA